MNLEVGAGASLSDETSERRRLEGLGRLAWGVAHDFNNILSTILCCTQLLERRLPRNENAWREIGEIRAAVRQGGQLTRLLQAYMRHDIARPEAVVDLDPLVMRLVRMLQHDRTGFPGLRFASGARQFRVRVEPLEFIEAMLEILAAVRDAAPEGGEIMLEVSEAQDNHALLTLSVTKAWPDAAWPGQMLRLVERLAATTALRPQIVPATGSALLRLRIFLPLDTGESG